MNDDELNRVWVLSRGNVADMGGPFFQLIRDSW
jgi:hypothetical protein